MTTSRGVAIVGGVLAGKAGNGGHAWSRISFVEGLRRLAFDVVLIEQQLDPSGSQREFFNAVCAEFDIDGHLLNGKPSHELVARASAASLLINIGGHLTDPGLKCGPRVKVFLDDDPGYTQIWHHDGLLEGRLEGHDFYFTFGQNVGNSDCALPVDGIRWRALRPPVVLEQWPAKSAEQHGFRTVASWRGAYGRVESQGRLFGQKAHEFRRFAVIPEVVPETFEIALDIDSADSRDADMMRGHGWSLRDPHDVAASPDAFRNFVQGAWAEFSVAQGIYVETNCGWFSDRTTRFLASGKPALVQDTGFGRDLPVGCGLLTFSTLEQAVAGASSIQRDYRTHADAARELAEKFFDSDSVLGRMVEEIGL
jgi:hypothetical protein